MSSASAVALSLHCVVRQVIIEHLAGQPASLVLPGNQHLQWTQHHPLVDCQVNTCSSSPVTLVPTSAAIVTGPQRS